MANSKFPQSLYFFYDNNKDKFEEKSNDIKKKIYLLIGIIGVAILIFPAIIPISPWLVRFIGFLIVVYGGFKYYVDGSSYYNKQSGGEIKKLLIKKFDMYKVTENEILDAFNKKEIDFLANAPSAEDQPIQLYVDEDEKGKEFYLLIMKYYSSSDFSGASHVLTLSGNEYDLYYDLIKSMK